MPVRIQKLDHFAIYVTDLERAEKFYGERLGMRVRTRIGAEQVLMECGETILALFAKPDLSTPVEPGAPTHPFGRAHFAVNVSAEDFAAARVELAGGRCTALRARQLGRS